MRIIFMGTPDFSVPCLEALANSEDQVVGVFTQPDKPKGRGYELCSPPVKECALKYNLPVFQPASMRTGEALDIINSLNADLIIVVAFGKILPKEILESVKYGCINIHASLLPRLRGSAPIQWSILNGDKVTGVTSMQMDVGVDTGDMLLKDEMEIPLDMTSEQLFDKLSQMGANLLIKTIKTLKIDELKPIKQDDSLSTHAPMISKDLCPIDFSKSALEVHNKVRGLYSWPIATTVINGKKYKIHKSAILEERFTGKIGEIVDNNNRLVIMCGDGKCIEILEIQAEGKRKTDAASFLRGHRTEIGTIIGG